MPRSTHSVAALVAVIAGSAAPLTLGACGAGTASPVASPAAAQERPTERPRPDRAPERQPEIRWRHSVAVGSPSAGHLIRGVQLPARGTRFSTWDPNLHRSPNRGWRRWGTDRLVRLLLTVVREYRAAHPHARPLLIGDLSRPHGGDFGRQFGYVWHASHQNGLDADVYFPRRDRARRAASTAAGIDRRLSQDLVNRFVRAGATDLFVGPNTGLTGPPDVVQVLVDHDDHVHVRIAP
jgi:murein endopeptidase